MWFFKRNKEEKTVTDEMRAKSLETRRLQHQIAQLEKQVEMKAQLGTLQEMLNGNNGSKGEEAMLMMLMNMIMQPQQNNSNPAIAINPPTSNPSNMAIARFLADKVPDNVLPQLEKTSDADIIDIKNQILKIKAGV